MSGEPGSGAGQGGGGGGSIRSAGGAFGKMEVAQEEQYFYNQVRPSIFPNSRIQNTKNLKKKKTVRHDFSYNFPPKTAKSRKNESEKFHFVVEFSFSLPITQRLDVFFYFVAKRTTEKLAGRTSRWDSLPRGANKTSPGGDRSSQGKNRHNGEVIEAKKLLDRKRAMWRELFFIFFGTRTIVPKSARISLFPGEQTAAMLDHRFFITWFWSCVVFRIPKCLLHRVEIKWRAFTS